MASLELRPFADQHVAAATRLLAERHVRHCAAEPLLAQGGAEQAVERAWVRDGASGAVALRDGEVVGYLVGRVGEHRHFDRHAWVERAGHAAADAELVRDLYATASAAWVEAGAKRHFALVPTLDDLLEPWYRLGFAQMHVDAIRESGGSVGSVPGGATIRRGGLGDVESAAIPIDRLVAEHQALPPSFSEFMRSEEEERADWKETLEAPGAAYFVIELDGRVVGHSMLYPADPDLGTADSVYLASTATVPDVRGTGIGLALTEHVLQWAREAGYGRVVTNWRATNLLASRFWPARGFRPTFHRLHRAVGVG